MNHVLSVEQVFTERLLRVPDYQRGYAWKEEHLTEFLEDLELLGVGKHHYTGTLVLHALNEPPRVDDEGRSYRCHDIVDGQQRMTTIVVLLDVIRRELNSQGLTKLAEGIRRTYIHTTGIDGQPMHKLVLNSDCHGYFIRNVLADNPSPDGPAIYSHERLRDARARFERHLSEKRVALGVHFRDWLLELRSKITQQLRLVLYVVDDAADVGVVFETMNNRGKQLAELEKVKNYLLYLTTKLDIPSPNLRDTINEAWATIFKNLMSAGLSDAEDQLLRAHWLMAYNPRAKEWNQSKSVKDKLGLRAYQGNHKALIAAIIRYATTLRDGSLAFCDIMMPSRSNSFTSYRTKPKECADIQSASEKLRRLGNMASFVPLLMAARSRFSTANEAVDYLEIVRLAEVFAFRVYGLLEKRANAGQSWLFSLAHELFTSSKGRSEVSDSIRGGALLYCSDQEFKDNMASIGDWYNKWSALKYFLYEYEEHLAHKHKVRVVEWAKVQNRKREDSVEHILPQTPSDPYWQTKFTAEQRKTYMHDLGNLCLTINNGSYRNKSFPNKKGTHGQMDPPCYATADLVMERVLAQHKDWNEQAILHRRGEMSAWACERWKVDPPSNLADEAVDEADEDEEAIG